MIVVDVGCMSYPDHPGDQSIPRLIERFRPFVLYGFDPHPDLIEGWTVQAGTSVRLRRLAAWTYDGEVGYTRKPVVLNDLRAFTSEAEDSPEVVPCFDLAAALTRLAHVDVLKIDVEGAEYVLLPHLITTGALELVDLLLIEWHETPNSPQAILERLIPCTVEAW